MDSSEQQIYLKTVKSMTNSFHEFLTEICKNEKPLTDDELMEQLQQISKTLQRVLSKCNKNNDFINGKENCDDTNTSKNCGKTKTKIFKSDKKINQNRSKLNEDEDTRNWCDEKININKREELRSKINEIVQSEIEEKMSEDECDIKGSFSCNSFEQKVDNLRKKVVNKDLSITQDKLYGSKCVYIEEYTPDVWKCTICKIDLPFQNIASHVNGKSHKNSIEQVENNNTSAIDLPYVLKDIDPNLIKSQKGLDYITTGMCYTCTLCKANFNSDFNLKQHIMGAKHKKLCQTEF